MASMGAIWGSATKPPKGIHPSPYCTPLWGFFPNRLAEPDLESLYFESAPACSKKMPQFVNKDDDVENDDNYEK